MRFAQVVFFIACYTLSNPSVGQDSKTPDKPGKKDKLEPVSGYKVHKIEGFTFLIQESVFAEDVSKYERKPLEVLELECKRLANVLSPKALDALHTLVVWVNWDDKVPLGNGRDGNALATYYGSSPAQITKDGKHPLQSKTVTIHSLKNLTAGRQPKTDRGVSLLLHEFAHAVHDQVLGFQHAGIKAAYQQAMERKLYDKDLYVATNEKEFFAEITCAYLDKLRYYPHDRADLQKHDPATFKLMETVWAGAAKKTETGKASGPSDGSDKFDLALTLSADVKFGPTVAGPEPAADALSGKVVVIGYWGGEFSNVLNRLDRLHDELAPYGLVAVAPFAFVRTADEVKAAAEKRGDGFAVLERALVTDKEAKTKKSQPAGHALVFDHTGKCVFRGSGYDLEKPVRAAIGRKLVAEACGGAEPPAAFKSVVEAFGTGADPVSVLPKVSPLTTSQNEETKAAAKKLAESILAPGQKMLADAQANAKTDPVAAFLAVEVVAARYKNTPLATKAQNMTTNLRQEKAVATELKARVILTQLQTVEKHLRGQPGSFNPNDTKFQTKHKAALAQMQGYLEQLRKQYPNSRATAEAEKAAREFGVQ
jgi:hypothetical protein